MNGNSGLSHTLKDLEVISAMRGFSLLVYGMPAAMMTDGDPRLEIDAAARLIAFWTHIGCSEEWQRQQIDCYDQAKEALAAYRALKAGEGAVLVNQAIAHQILKANLSDGAKVAALAALLTEARSARDIATSTDRAVRSVERHYAELRTWDCANLRRGQSYAEMRSHDHGEDSANETGKADASPGAGVSRHAPCDVRRGPREGGGSSNVGPPGGGGAQIRPTRSPISGSQRTGAFCSSQAC